MSNPPARDPNATAATEAAKPAEQNCAGVENQEGAEDREEVEAATKVGDNPQGMACDEAITDALAVSDAEPTEVLAVNDAEPTEVLAVNDAEPTEVLAKPRAAQAASAPTQRRYTAPSSFDRGTTEIIDLGQEAATETLSAPAQRRRSATPQSIPPRPGAGRPPARSYRSWGWVMALILVIAALAAVAIMGTVWLTQKAAPPTSQEDMVRETIQNFDAAVQKGDLGTLRGITCGTTRDSYVNYDDKAWQDAFDRVTAAKQYPVVASIDQVIVNGDHAEANVTSFMAYAPQTRSTRSFDLQYREGQWKICQTP